MVITIRREQPQDAAAIGTVTEDAFRNAPHTTHTEQFIVSALRESGQLAVSLVADLEGRVVGHVALSPVTISDGSIGWYGLGPISVVPEHQRQEIGSALMKQAIAELRMLNARGCVLVGDPDYYTRFGFRTAPSLVLPDVPSEYFLAILLEGDFPAGTVAFQPAFQSRDQGKEQQP